MNSTPFSPKCDALADSDPGLSPVEASESTKAKWYPDPDGYRRRRASQNSGSGRGYGASKGEAGTDTPPGPVGALTGLELPREWASGDDGLELQPLQPGLPDTEIDACKALIIAVAVQGLRDHDLSYITSPVFIHHLIYAGLDPDAALNVKIAYLQGRVIPSAFDAAKWDRQRRVEA